jgi:hypothetical protein
LAAQSVDGVLPLRFETARVAVILVDPIAASSIVGDSALQLLVVRCRNVMAISSEDSAYAVQHRSRDVARPGLGVEPWMVSFLVVARPTAPAACADREAQQLIAPTRGLSFTSDTVTRPTSEPYRALLMRGDHVIEPADTLRGSTYRLTPLGARFSRRGFARVAVALESLMPGSDGIPADVWLAVWFGDDTVATKVPVPTAIVAQLWERALVHRLDRATASAPDPEIVAFRPRPPVDRRLRIAYRDYTSGYYDRAAISAVQRMRDTVVTDADAVSAYVGLGLIALAHGDTVASRVAFARALADEPCLSLAADAPQEAREVFGALRRPSGDCRRGSLPVIALRGAALPGFGRAPTLGRKAMGAGTILAIGATTYLGFGARDEARIRYQEYLAVQRRSGWLNRIQPELDRLYDQADEKRRESRGWWRVAGGLWVASIGEALLQEQLRRRHLATVQAYGSGNRDVGASTPRFTPITEDGRFGVALTFF